MHKIRDIDLLNPLFYSKKENLVNLYDYDIARMLDALDDDMEILSICKQLENDKLSRVIPKCKKRIHILNILGERKPDILEEMDVFYLKKIINSDNSLYKYISPGKKEILDDVITSGNYRVSFYITDKYINIKLTDTKEEIINKISKIRTNLMYVSDDKNHFVGVVRIGEYLTDYNLEKHIHTKYPILNKNDFSSDFVKINDKYHEEGYPVLDGKRLYGVIDFRGIENLVNEELIDDYYKLGGMTDFDPYKDDGVTMSKRLPWLVIALICDFLLCLTLTFFTDRIVKYPIFSIWLVFVLIISSACCINTLGTTVRIFSHKKARNKTVIKYIHHEFQKGLVIGLVLGVITFVVFYFYQALTRTTIRDTVYYSTDAMLVALTMGAIVILTVIEGTFIGALMPIIIDKLHYDFSIATMIFVTTICDAFSAFIFFGFTYIWFPLQF